MYLSGVDVEQLGRLSGGLESVVVTSQQQAGGLQGQSHALQLGVVRTTNQLQHENIVSAFNDEYSISSFKNICKQTHTTLLTTNGG